MTFQFIDKKLRCKNIYKDGKITAFNVDEETDTKTWEYHSCLNNKSNIEFAYLYTNGLDFKKIAKENFPEWKEIEKKYIAHAKAFKTAKVCLNNHCFYDFLPENFVKEFFEVKNKTTEYVLNNFEKPTNYQFLVELSKLINKIESQDLNLNLNNLRSLMIKKPARNFIYKVNKRQNHILYDIFGSITGRLTTKKDSFPILTMNKDYRGILEPQNNIFVEIDFNAAELRTVLALNGKEQPKEDLHNWHASILNKVYGDDLSREEIKRKMFAWLYGGSSTSLGIPEIESFYNKENIINKYWNGKEVNTYYSRKIQSDGFHAFNTIIQSTSNDIFLRNSLKLNEFLLNRKSFISWLMHDSVTIDFSMEDKSLLDEILKIFKKTDFGDFTVNVRIGKNFKNMRKVKL